MSAYAGNKSQRFDPRSLAAQRYAYSQQRATVFDLMAERAAGNVTLPPRFQRKPGETAYAYVQRLRPSVERIEHSGLSAVQVELLAQAWNAAVTERDGENVVHRGPDTQVGITGLPQARVNAAGVDASQAMAGDFYQQRVPASTAAVNAAVQERQDQNHKAVRPDLGGLRSSGEGWLTR